MEQRFLFDEIEKAHRGVVDVFISLLDEGQITDLDGSRISVGNAYLVLTSNIGAARWGSMETTRGLSDGILCIRASSLSDVSPALQPADRNDRVRLLSQKVQIDILKEMLGRKLVHLESRVRDTSLIGG